MGLRNEDVWTSPLWDAGWYLSANPDVAQARLDPLEHYLSYGAKEGRDPHPLFQSRWYLDTYPDVARTGLNPFKHFLLHGLEERRNPNPLFDTGWYLDAYPDIAKARVDPLQHYVEHGHGEGRDPGPNFSTAWYLDRNPDVAAAKVNGLAHYLQSGRKEGRRPVDPDGAGPRVAVLVRLGEQAKAAEWLNAFVRLGVQVDVYLTDEPEGRHAAGAPDWVAGHMGQAGHALAISFEHALLADQVVAAQAGRILVLLDHDPAPASAAGGDIPELLPELQYAAFSKALVDRIKVVAPRMSHHVRHWPSPTARTPSRRDPEPVKHQISWVAGRLSTSNLDDLFRVAGGEQSNMLPTILDCVRKAGADRDFDVAAFCRRTDLASYLRKHKLPMDRFVVSVWNLHSNRDRGAVLDTLSDHSLAVFGNAEWLARLEQLPRLEAVFQTERIVSTRAEAQRVYDRSRISLVVPERRARGRLTGQMTDIMASDALLVTPYDSQSELLAWFGPTSPVPTYASLEELREICDHFLGNEDERLAKVRDCHAALDERFSFELRCSRMLGMFGRPTPPPGVGSVRYQMVPYTGA